MYVYVFELQKEWMKKVIVVGFSNQIKKIFQALQLRVLIVRPVQLKIIYQLRNLRNYAIYVTEHACY